MKIKKSIYRVKIECPSEYGEVTNDEFEKAKGPYEKFDFIETLDFVEPDDGETQRWYNCPVIKDDYLVLTEDQILELATNNIKFNVEQVNELEVDITKQLMELAEKPVKLINESGSTNNYNSKCEVHMPNQALSLYNEMLLLEDACTDELQSRLNSGYRIIAACPQPDQRRPDYILGRFSPDLDVSGRAER